VRWLTRSGTAWCTGTSADLVALLDDFAWAHKHEPTPFDMDVARIRRELGIEP
jgi:hypothetical protein